MNQSKTESFIERTVDMASAVAISTAIFEYVIRDSMDYLSSFQVVMIFTIVSFIRGYFWRRFFNNGLHKAVHNFLLKIKL